MTFSVLSAWALTNYGSTLTVDGESFTGVDLTHLDTIQLGASGHSEVTDWTWAGSFLTPAATGDKQTMLVTMFEHWTHDYKLPISEAGNYQVSAWVVGSFWSSTSQTWTMSLSLNGTSWTSVDTFTDNAFMKWEKLQGQIEASGSGFVWVRFETSDSENPLVAGLMLEKEDAGTQYNQSASGTATPAGALAKSVGKPDAGSLSPSGVLARLTTPGTKTGSVTPAGAISRLTTPGAKAGILTPSGALATAPTYGQSIAGTLTPAGNLARSSAKALAGSATPTGNLSSALTFGKFITGTVAAVGAILRDTTIDVTGALAPAGAAARQVARTLSGTLAPSGALSTLLAFYKLIAGSIAPSGGVSLSALKTVAGTITPVGSLSRAAAKTLAAAIAPEGGVLRSVAKAVTGALVAAGALAAEKSGAYLQSVGGAITAAGSLARQTSHTITGTLTPAAALVRSIAVRFAGAIAPSGTLSAVTAFVTGLLTAVFETPVVARVATGTARVAKVIASAIAARIGVEE